MSDHSLCNMGGRAHRPSKTIEVSGVTLTVRDLRPGEAKALERLFPAPIAPLGPDPRAGSKAPPIPRTDNPTYRKQSLERYRAVHPAELAIATGWKDPSGRAWSDLSTDEQRKAWATAAGVFVDEELTEGEVAQIDAAREELARGPGGIAEPPGNA